ncbi:MAG: protease pro-enzyme activation domain-containing protein [Actinomycetales bacterium]
MRRRTIGISVIATAAMTVAGVSTAAGAANPPAKRAVPNSKPAWTAHAKNLGHASSSGRVSLRVYLAPNGGLDALKAAVASVSDPKSSNYRTFMSAAQYHAAYDPSTSTLAGVRSWLTSNGLKVTGVEASRRYVSVSGSVAAAEKAFGANIDRYSHNGQSVQANSSALTVPASLGASVLTVTGVDTTPHVVQHASTPQAPPPAGFRNGRPCSITYGQLAASNLPAFKGKTLPYAVCGYTGPQYRAAYEDNLSAGLDGSGVTVAITDAYAAPTIVGDSNKYATRHGDGAYAPGQFSQVKPGSFNRGAICGPSGWYGEETLDVEAVHAMAPGANIRFYASPSCFDDDFLTTLAKVADDDRAQLVTNSWGDVEQVETTDQIAAYEQVFLQGAMQGQSFMFSSGDNGDELANTGIRQTDYPTSDPYVTLVGGTSDAIGASGKFTFQTGWGTHKYSLSSSGNAWTPLGFLYGAGGGHSSLFNEPAYQAGVVPGSNGAGRAVPDVGLDGDPTTGMLVGETQSFPDGVYYDEYRIGGTSLASPLFAGMTALLLQHAGGGMGLLNPTIYAQAGSSSFKDIHGAPKDAGNVRADYANGVDPSGGIVYSVRTFDQDSSLTLAKGWDDVTGVGSPTADWVTSVG